MRIDKSYKYVIQTVLLNDFVDSVNKNIPKERSRQMNERTHTQQTHTYRDKTNDFRDYPPHY